MSPDEPTRPQYHFTPAAGWMNDPNGMVYYKSEYHLFYQYYPGGYGRSYADSLKWGPMHWGHAVSEDLVHWQHLPVALRPDSGPEDEVVRGMIYSGSAAIDWNNTGGFRNGDEDVMVAAFTLADAPGGVNQRQGIAYSNDRGRTWTKYAGNPVLPNPGRHDFRDPKIFRHEASRQWFIVAAAYDRVELYTSPDLKNWTYASEFGPGQGSQGFSWECPDLFELPVDGDPANKKWIMIVSVQDQAPNGGSGTQYFVGDFDGKRFSNDNSPERILWLDYGRDNYTGITWSDYPANSIERMCIGWMSNWDYAADIPALSFRNAMTLPRVLRAKTLAEGVRVVSEPVPGLKSLRKPDKLAEAKNTDICGDTDLFPGDFADTLEIIAAFRVDEDTTATEFGFKLRKKNNNATLVGYDRLTQQLFVDRSRSGGFAFTTDSGRHTAPLEPENGAIKLHIFLDRTSVEVLANDGRRVITDLIFPPADATELEIYSVQGTVTLESLVLYQLNSIYTSKECPVTR